MIFSILTTEKYNFTSTDTFLRDLYSSARFKINPPLTSDSKPFLIPRSNSYLKKTNKLHLTFPDNGPTAGLFLWA